MSSRRERDEELRRRTMGSEQGAGYIGGSALPGGMIPSDSHGRKPSPIIHVPSKNPIGGPQQVTSTPGVLAQLGYLTTPDGVPRKMTLLVTQNTGISNQAGAAATGSFGLYLKLTIGMDRGSVSQWIAAPCVFPLEGSFAKVEATISGTPFTLQNTGNGKGTPPVAVVSPNDKQLVTQATAILIDGWTDPGPDMILAQTVACNPGSNVLVAGPVIVSTIALTNTGASAVLMAICETASGSLQPAEQLALAYVPANSSVSVGSALLGAFGTGVNIYGVTPPTWASDPNGTSVYATIRGRYLIPGGM